LPRRPDSKSPATDKKTRRGNSAGFVFPVACREKIRAVLRKSDFLAVIYRHRVGRRCGRFFGPRRRIVDRIRHSALPQEKYLRRSRPLICSVFLLASNRSRRLHAIECRQPLRRRSGPAEIPPEIIFAKWLTSEKHMISFRPSRPTTAEASDNEPVDNARK